MKKIKLLNKLSRKKKYKNLISHNLIKLYNKLEINFKINSKNIKIQLIIINN